MSKYYKCTDGKMRRTIRVPIMLTKDEIEIATRYARDFVVTLREYLAVCTKRGFGEDMANEQWERDQIALARAE